MSSKNRKAKRQKDFAEKQKVEEAPKLTIQQPIVEVAKPKPKQVEELPVENKEIEFEEELPDNLIITFGNHQSIPENCHRMNLNAELIVRAI